MATSSIIFLVLLFVIIFLFITELAPIDLTALVGLLVFFLLGIIDKDEVFSGFSSPAVITMMATFFLGAALRKTGVADIVAEIVHNRAGKNELYNIAAVMFLGAFLSAFMTNVAAVAVLLPAVVSIAHHADISPSRLLLPLAFSAVLGGTMTLIGTTPNILIGDLMVAQGLTPFSFFSFSPIGGLFVLFGIISICLTAKFLLPQRGKGRQGRTKRDLRKVYKLGERLFSLKFGANSPLVGSKLSATELRERFDLQALAILRNGKTILAPSPDTIIENDDIIIVRGKINHLQKELPNLIGVTLEDVDDDKLSLESADVEIIEVVLSPRSSLIGKTLPEISFREKYGYQVLALWRAGRPVRSRVAIDPLHFGDALLLQGAKEKRPLLKKNEDFVVLSKDLTARKRHSKAWVAIVALALTVILSVSGLAPVHISAFCGGAFAVMFGAIKMSDGYREIEWRIIFLLACLIPIGGAVESTGLAEYFARILIDNFSSFGPYAILIALTLFASFLSQTLDGSLAVVLLAPITVEAAKAGGMNPYALLMGIALASSIAFLTPFSHKANLLVMGAGGYRVKDYFKIGMLVTIVSFAVLWVFLPIFYPLV